MKKELKEVTRLNLPETNSSSSHSVAITIDDNIELDDDLNLDIRDNILYLDFSEFNSSFGWDYFKSNDPKTKLKYLLGIYAYSYRKRNFKGIKKFKEVIKRALKLDDVVIDVSSVTPSVDIYGDETICAAFPDIDHESVYIFPEIIENDTVIRNFILNKNCWLFGGNDNSEPDDEEFYKELTLVEPDTGTEIYGSINLCNLGELNFIKKALKLQNGEYGYISSDLFYLLDQILFFDSDECGLFLRSLEYDKTSNTFRSVYPSPSSVLTFVGTSLSALQKKYENTDIFIFLPGNLVVSNNKFNIIFGKPYILKNLRDSRIFRPIKMKEFEEMIPNKNDYVLFPIDINYNNISL